MRVWTDGARHLVLAGHGLDLYERGERRPLHSHGVSDALSRGHLSSIAGVAASSTEPRAGVLPSGRPLVLPGVARIDWIDGLRRTQDARVDALVLWGTHVLASVTSERGAAPALLVRALDALWEERREPDWRGRAQPIVLPAPKDVAWPIDAPGRIWTKPPRPSGRQTRPWQLAASAHGVTAVDLDTGIIAVLGPSPGPIRGVLRVPVEAPEMMLDAVATPRGVLVGFGGGRGDGAIHHFALDGAQLWGDTVEGIAVPVAVSGSIGFAAVGRERFSSELEVRAFDLESGVVQHRIATGLSSTTGASAIAVSDEGRAIVVGDGAEVRAFEQGASGWSPVPLVRAVEADPEPAPVAARPATPRRVRHAKFGVGTVVSESGVDQERSFTIAFDEAGTKVLRARFVTSIE